MKPQHLFALVSFCTVSPHLHSAHEAVGPSLARATPLSSSSSSSKKTLSDCNVSQVAFQYRVISEINSCKIVWSGTRAR